MAFAGQPTPPRAYMGGGGEGRGRGGRGRAIGALPAVREARADRGR